MVARRPLKNVEHVIIDSTNYQLLDAFDVGTGVWMMGIGGACAVLVHFPFST
jgi:hypothetical protein